MSDLLQQAVTGLAAAGAAFFILRRLVKSLRRPAMPEACEHCAVSTLAVEARDRRPSQP